MENNTAQLEARLQKLESQAQRIAQAGAIEAILRNRVQQTAIVGAVVAAAGAITLDANLTTVGPTGKIRISAAFSGQPAVGASCKPILQVKIGGGAFVTVYAWAAETGVADDAMTCSAVFEFDSAAAPGTVLAVHWQTTAGDGNLTLGAGAGAGPFAAALLVEELA